MATKHFTLRYVGQVVATLIVALGVLGAAERPAGAQALPDVTPAAVWSNRWQRTTPLPIGWLAMPAGDRPRMVATSTHIYVLGEKVVEGGSAGVIYSAPILAAGALGAWEEEPPSLTPLPLDTVFVHAADYIYLIGGLTSQDGVGSTSKAVMRALVQSDGSLGTWLATTSLNEARQRHTAAVYNGFIYVIGGVNPELFDPMDPMASRSVRSVEMAKIQADGTLGAWQNTTELPPGPDSRIGFAINGSICVLAGSEALPTDYTINDVILCARIAGDGSLEAWQTAIQLTGQGRIDAGITVHGSHVLIMGGQRAGVSDELDSVESTEVRSDGTFGAWQPAASLTGVRYAHAVVVSESRVYVSGGRDSSRQIIPSVEWIGLNDGIPPELEPNITINDGALFTNRIDVTITLQAPSRIANMMVSNDGGFAGATWGPYVDSKAWTITQYGESVIPRVVYAKFRTYDGEVSSVFQDDIILDVTAPEGSVQVEPTGVRQAQAAPAAVRPSAALSNTVFLPTVICATCRAPSTPNVTLRLSAQDDASGVGTMLVSNSPSFVSAKWEPFGHTKAWSVPTGASTTVYVKFKDNAGNISDAVHDTVTVP